MVKRLIVSIIHRKEKDITMLKTYFIADTFGIQAPAHLKVEGFEPDQNPAVPQYKPYIFRRFAG